MEVLVLLVLYGFAIPFSLKLHKLVNFPNIPHHELWYRYVPESGNWHGVTMAALSAAPLSLVSYCPEGCWRHLNQKPDPNGTSLVPSGFLVNRDLLKNEHHTSGSLISLYELHNHTGYMFELSFFHEQILAKRRKRRRRTQ